jgi:hypothetical protein
VPLWPEIGPIKETKISAPHLAAASRATMSSNPPSMIPAFVFWAMACGTFDGLRTNRVNLCFASRATLQKASPDGPANCQICSCRVSRVRTNL